MAGLLETIVRRLTGNARPRKTVRVVRRAALDITTDTPKMNTTGTTEANDRTIRPERTQIDVEKEDYLLNQIDEFREKAQQLQELLLSKESKVMELQTIVDEREGQAKALEDILSEKQKEADGITKAVSAHVEGISAAINEQIDGLIGKVTAKMDELGVSIGQELEEGQKLSEEQATELKTVLESLTGQLETMKSELADKVHTENVKGYRNVSDLFKCMEDKLDSVNGLKQQLETVQKHNMLVIILAGLNLLGLAALALLQLGVF